ncbi:hypothetical protein SERLADRAFT_398018, partial [Serpula lacrymans var. lacrymans S7.9]
PGFCLQPQYRHLLTEKACLLKLPLSILRDCFHYERVDRTRAWKAAMKGLNTVSFRICLKRT